MLWAQGLRGAETPGPNDNRKQVREGGAGAEEQKLMKKSELMARDTGKNTETLKRLNLIFFLNCFISF